MFNYIKETKSEMKHVSWPSKNQVIMFTILVIVISVVLSLFLGFFDGLFKYAFEKFLINR